MQNPKVGDIIQNYKSLKALLTPKNVTNIFSRMDINNDNEISLLEWLTFCEEELEKLEGEQNSDNGREKNELNEDDERDLYISLYDICKIIIT